MAHHDACHFMMGNASTWAPACVENSQRVAGNNNRLSRPRQGLPRWLRHLGYLSGYRARLGR